MEVADQGQEGLCNHNGAALLQSIITSKVWYSGGWDLSAEEQRWR